ncbi:hypothetical protein MLD38_004859 [Melastoma candidum]|uniref:Uncharacterized protein n=1 Tax=Melastoma candidum TaxID=119954 RepID=A0ACB9S7W7_9MYRT|nr:hypothetical protein MLD38_004859 [Melastoma candidum]
MWYALAQNLACQFLPLVPSQSMDSYRAEREPPTSPRRSLSRFVPCQSTIQPLPTKRNLRKKRASEGRSTDEIEQFLAPASITVRQRPTVSAVELKDPENVLGRGYEQKGRYALSPELGHSEDVDSLESQRKLSRVRDVDQFSREEVDDYMSE